MIILKKRYTELNNHYNAQYSHHHKCQCHGRDTDDDTNGRSSVSVKVMSQIFIKMFKPSNATNFIVIASTLTIRLA